MNGSSRFAGHRGELAFAKGLLGSIDQHVAILELEAWIEIAHELKKTGDRIASVVWAVPFLARLNPFAHSSFAFQDSEQESCQ
jgi:hypothetical protein